jgi:hypothetical protein
MFLQKIYDTLNYFIAAIWFINGLFCKVFNLVPRHRQIVAGVIGQNHATEFTVLIGIAEIVMAVWILSNFKSKLNTLAQMAVIIIMNILEFILVPHLLLWGRFNLVFAVLLVAIIWYNQFVLNPKVTLHTKQ